MATSVQACLHSSCKSQHQMKGTTKSPTVLRRSSMRQNAANRKSAVERLEESKANYVKSERVLDSKQEFKNSSHLRISTGPHLDALFKAPPKQESIVLPSAVDDSKLSYLRVHHHSNVQVSKSPPLRVRAKSHSEFRETHLTRKHSFASQCSRHRIEVLIDIESQLKRLITSGSHENISIPQETGIPGIAHQKAQLTTPKISKPSEIPKVRRGYSDPVRKSCWPPPDLSPDLGIHKSMPDLSPSPLSPRVLVPSLSHNSDDFVTDHAETVQYFTPERKVSASNCTTVKKIERCGDGFEPYEEPRRFSNGTGMLHLTPYYSASSQLQRKPVSRSKSDVSHRYSKQYLPRKNNYTSAEIERFFDTMGLDTNAWHHITSPSLVSSPPCFFESVSSVDSNEDKSSACSEDSVSEVPRKGLRNQDLRGHGPLETSIVEKNARVIKWLYNCRKSACES